MMRLEDQYNLLGSMMDCAAGASASLDVFSPCKDGFDPVQDWLDGQSPAHPLFDQAGKIDQIVHGVKAELYDAILAGCRYVLDRCSDAPPSFSAASLWESLIHDICLWKAVISVHKYGVIYLANRAEARAFHPLYLARRPTADQIDEFLRHNGNFFRAVNYAVHRFIASDSNQVIYPSKLVPPNAISSLGHRIFAVREKDFVSTNIEARLDDDSVLWDLHDFAHQATASLAPTLYGSKYFCHLQYLPPSATVLIRSPGICTADKGPKLTDGLVFSELLTGLYTSEVGDGSCGSTRHTYASLENTLATAVADYLLGKSSLLHPSTAKMLKLDHAITLPQLAVLVQNKAYELPASEMEQRIFTRGGPAGDERDQLDKLTTGERLEAIASNRTWMYFEVRNTIKHRAHKAAYRRVAATYQEQSDSLSAHDAKLLAAIVEALDYKDWETDGPSNLWALIAELGCYSNSANH